MVSKFKDLCAAAEAARDRYLKCLLECRSVAGVFVSGLKQYLELPDGACYLFRPGDARGTPIADALDALDVNEDGFMTVGVALVLTEPGTFPRQVIGFPLETLRAEAGYTLRVDKDKTFTVSGGRVEEFVTLCEHIYASLMRRFEKNMDGLLSKDTGGIGFHVIAADRANGVA